MKGAYEFLVTIKPDAEDSSRLVVDVRCVLMSSGRRGYITNSSWTCDAKDGPRVIQDSLVSACQWLNTCVEKEERKLNNAVACQDAGK